MPVNVKIQMENLSGFQKYFLKSFQIKVFQFQILYIYLYKISYCNWPHPGCLKMIVFLGLGLEPRMKDALDSGLPYLEQGWFLS